MYITVLFKKEILFLTENNTNDYILDKFLKQQFDFILIMTTNFKMITLYYFLYAAILSMTVR